MPQSGPIFRVFVSSTFEDFTAERNALQTRVFPRLRRLCAAHGARLHMIDLRWGVSEAAARDQMTMPMCLAEIERCQRLTPRPNFIALLGDRFGWQPLPATIPAAEFEAIQTAARSDDAALVAEWYRLDANSVPETFVLRPRNVEQAQWANIEVRLRGALRSAIADIAPEALQRVKYEASACEQELEAALGAERLQRGQVFGFVRQIEGLAEGRVGEPFVDLGPDGRRDRDAAQGVNRLQQRLRTALPDGVETYRVRIDDGEVEAAYIDRLCADVLATLEPVILDELAGVTDVDRLDWEVAQQHTRMDEVAGALTGRADALATIDDYLAVPSSRPLVIHGPAGSGKTTLVAEAARRLAASRPDAELLMRFVGETASSSSLRTLLLSLCTQLSRSYGFDESSLPIDEDELRAEFTDLVELSSAKRPPVIFVDAPDQLLSRDGTEALSWIPSEIPKHARMVISVRPGPGLEALAERIPASRFVALERISSAEGSQILDGWLHNAGRTLQDTQRDAVLGSFAALGLPLQLRLAFEQARGWSSSESPPARLAEDVASLVRQLMERLSEEGNHGRVLVERSTGYLAASRSGLTEDELVDLLSADPAVMDDFRRRSPRSPAVDRLPMVVWSRLFFDLGPWLSEGAVDDTSVLAIQSREIRSYVEETYLDGTERLLRHQAIADYFDPQPHYLDHDDGASTNLRKLSELPYQQAHGQLWEDMQRTLTDFSFLQARLGAVGIEALLEDFELVLAAGCPGLTVQSIRDALRLSAHALRSDPDQLGSQLIMRLAEAGDPVLERLIQGARGTPTTATLEPIGPAGSAAIVPGGPLLRTLPGHRLPVTAIAMFGDRRRALSSSQDGTLRVWRLDSGRQMSVLAEEATADESIFSHLGEIHDVALTPDEKRAVAGTANAKIAIWDLSHGSQLAALRGHQHHVRSVAVTFDGTRVVSGSWDHTIRVWSLRGIRELATLQGHATGVEAIAVTPDGTRLVSGDRDGVIKIWDITATADSPMDPITIAELQTLPGHDGSVNAVVTTNDGRAISGGGDGTLRVWDLATGLETVVLETNATVRSLAVSPDGERVLAGGSGGTTIWDITSGARLDTFDGSATAVAFAPDGRQFLSGSSSGELHLWQLETTDTTTAPLVDHQRASPVLSPILVLGDRTAISATRDCALATWDLDTGRPVHVKAGHTDAITAVAAIPDQRVVSASKDGTLKVWDPDQGEQLAEFASGSGAISAVAAIPDQRIVSASDDGTLKVWDLERGEQLAELTHGQRWFMLSVTPDGTRAVTKDHTALKLWNLRDPALLQTLKPGPGTSPALAISPDGRSAVEGATNLWDLEQGLISHRLIDASSDQTDLVASYLKPFTPPGDRRLQNLVSAVRTPSPFSAVITPDSNRVIQGSMDGTLRIWDLRTAELLHVLEGHADTITSIAITADGNRAATVSRTTIILWDLAELEPLATFTGDGNFRTCGITPNGQAIIVDGPGGIFRFRPVG